MEFGDHVDLAKNQLLNAKMQNLGSSYPTPQAGIFYFNTATNLAYYINNGGTEVAMGGSINAFGAVTDGTTTASASGTDTFKLRSANNKLTVAVQSNDATHGDNALFTVNEANIDHGSIGGLSDDDHSQYALLAGRSGGQTLIGGTAASNSLTIKATSHGTSGSVILDPGTSTTYKGTLSSTGVWTVGDGLQQVVLTPRTAGDTGAAISVADTETFHVGFTVAGTGAVVSASTYTGTRFVSTVSTGTAPFTVASTTVVTNLNADLLDGQSGAYYLARGNGTGTQTASTISDLATVVQAYRLDQFASPNTSVSMNSQRLTGLADPTSAQDAATKNYVDTAVQGLDIHPSVRVATGSNVTVTYSSTGGTSGRGQITGVTNTVDGVSVALNDRILLFGQSTAAQNGIWKVSTVGTGANGVWDRATDFDADAEVTSGAFVFVEAGTNASNGYVLTNPNPVTIGGASGTSLTFSQFSGAGQITSGAGMTKTGNTLDVGAGTGITVNADNVQLATGGLPLALHNLATNGILARTAAGTVAALTIGNGNSGISITNGDGVAGNPSISVSTALQALHTLVNAPSTGFLVSTAANSAASRSFSNGTGITWTNADGVSGNPTAALTGQALAFHNLAGNGIAVKTGSGTATNVTITGSSSITVSNGDGVAGNPTLSVNGSWSGHSNITTLGTITSGTWSATTIAVDRGGTGLTSYTVGDMMYASGTGSTISKLAAVAVGNVLISGGVSTAPAWGKVQLSGGTTHINGTLGAGNGGTGVTSFGGTNTLLYTTAANTLASVTTAANGFVITNGSSAPVVSNALPAFTSANTSTWGHTSAGISPHISVIDEADISPRGIAIQQHSAGKPALLDMYRSRGTYSSPSSVANDDYASVVFSSVHDGTAYRAVGAYGYRVASSGVGSVGTNSIPGEWFWAASQSDAPDPYVNGTVRMRLTSAGDLIVTGSITGTLNVTNVSGTLPSNKGGTGLSSFTAGDMLYYASGTALSKLAAGSNTQVLVGGTTPAWGAVTLGNGMVSGTLTTDKGGTGLSGGTPFTGADRLLVSSSSSALTTLATANNGVLVTNGSGTPSISNTLPAVNGSAVTSLSAGNLSGAVAIANGGTSQTTKSAARGSSGLADSGKRLVQQYEVAIGNGSLTTIDVVHNLGTTNINWNITKVSDGSQILTTGRAFDSNTLRLTFSVAPASSSLNVLVTG